MSHNESPSIGDAGDMKEVRRWIEVEGDNGDRIDGATTVLHHICCDADDDGCFDSRKYTGEGRKEGWSALKVAQYLVQEGASVNESCVWMNGASPLHLAFQSDNLELVRFLVEEAGADIMARDWSNATVLHWCGCGGKVATFVLSMLKSDDAPNSKVNNPSEDSPSQFYRSLDVNAQDKNGRSPLLRFVRKRRDAPQVFWAFVKHPDVDVNLADALFEDTALSWLASSSDKDAINEVMFLLNVREAKMDKAIGSDGFTALHRACERYQNDNTMIIKTLLERNPKMVDMKDFCGRTPLHVATNIGRIRNLIEDYGADVNAKDEDGKTPLHHACISLYDSYYHAYNNYIRWNFRQVVELLGSYLTMEDNDGRTPLDLFVEQYRQYSGSYFYERNQWEDLQSSLCLLISKQPASSLKPNTARGIWNYFRDNVVVRDERQACLVDRWPLRMRWLSSHCQRLHGISPSDTLKYPVHAVLLCSQSLLMPPPSGNNHDGNVVDWKEIFAHFETKHYLSPNQNGLVPLQVYLLQEQESYRQRLKVPEHEGQPHNLLLNLTILSELGRLDTRLSSLTRNFDRKRDADGATYAVVDPYSTPLAISVDTGGTLPASPAAKVEADRLLLNLLYGLIRVQPQTLKRAAKRLTAFASNKRLRLAS